MDEQKLIHNPPQKVLALYQAVIEFINEGCDSMVNVSELTLAVVRFEGAQDTLALTKR